MSNIEAIIERVERGETTCADADALGTDVEAGAVEKSGRDVERGVRV